MADSDPRTAPAEEILTLVHSAEDAVLLALLENPQFDLSHLEILLQRQDLTATVLEAVAKLKKWQGEDLVRRGLVLHPHTPRLIAMRLLRQVYLMDLVQASLLPAVPIEIRRLAEEQIITRLGQLPLGQKLTLARRASARVAGALIAEGSERVARAALDNPYLTEAQVLKALAKEKLLEAVVAAVAAHAKWSLNAAVRLALVRHPLAPLARVIAFLKDFTPQDLKLLADASSVPASLRNYIRAELSRRK